MKPLLTLLLILSFFPSIFFAQDLELVHEKQGKTIKVGTFIEVEINGSSKEPCNICAEKFVTGKLICYETGKLIVSASIIDELVYKDSVIIGHSKTKITKRSHLQQWEIPTDEILSIQIKGKKKIHDNSFGETLGNVLIVLGTGHLTSAPLVEDGGILLGAGLIELTFGIVLSSSASQKDFITHPDCPKARGKSPKIWEFK